MINLKVAENDLGWNLNLKKQLDNSILINVSYCAMSLGTIKACRVIFLEN